MVWLCCFNCLLETVIVRWEAGGFMQSLDVLTVSGSKTIGYWHRECYAGWVTSCLCLPSIPQAQSNPLEASEEREEREKEKNNFPFWNSQLEVWGSEKSLLVSVQGDYTIRSKQVSQSKTHSCFFWTYDCNNRSLNETDKLTFARSHRFISKTGNFVRLCLLILLDWFYCLTFSGSPSSLSYQTLSCIDCKDVSIAAHNSFCIMKPNNVFQINAWKWNNI